MIWWGQQIHVVRELCEGTSQEIVVLFPILLMTCAFESATGTG